jgi:hypothetical protein
MEKATKKMYASNNEEKTQTSQKFHSTETMKERKKERGGKEENKI